MNDSENPPRSANRRRRLVAVGGAAVALIVATGVLVPVLRHDDHHTDRDRFRSAVVDPAGVLRSRLVRDTRPAVPATTVARVTAANTATAIDLYDQLAKTPGNVFFSPYSITTALTMAAAGARGETLSQMLAVLHNQLPASMLQDATNALNLALLAPRAAPTTSGKPLELEVANSEWSQAGYPIEPGFLDLLARDYGAALNSVDFQHDAARATSSINAWVDAHTNHKISKLFDRLDPTTKLVLVNAVHFKASWAQPFAANATSNGQFAIATGNAVSVPFLHGVVESGYAAGPGWNAVDLPYIGDASMTLIVPDAGQFRHFEQSFDATELAHIIGQLAPAAVTLSMPKLTLKDSSNLVPALTALGMKDAFADADFSGITGNRALAISQVVHQATITVDEKGTEAAAATGIAMTDSAVLGGIVLNVDRPYLMLIRDHKTGSILFFGRITDPAQQSVRQP